MIKEIDFFGVYLSPMMGYIAVALLIWFLIRFLLGKAGFYRFVWHRALFNTALFIILLSTLVLFTL